MSTITDIILVTASEDSHIDDGKLVINAYKMNDFKDWLNKPIVLTKVDHRSECRRAMQCDVYVSAANCLECDLEKSFIDLFRSIDWEYPECAQLMLKHENDDLFSVYTVNKKGE